MFCINLIKFYRGRPHPPYHPHEERALSLGSQTSTIIFAWPSSAIRLLTKLPPLASPLHRLRSLSTRGGIAAGTVRRGVAMQPTKRQRPPDALGEEMKRYEAETCNAMVDTSRPCVVRLDGHWCVVRRAHTQHQWRTPTHASHRTPAAFTPTPRASAGPTTRASTRRWSPPPPTCSSASEP